MFLTSGFVSVGGGLLLGGALGYALQRGGFCMNSAFRSIAFEKDHSLVRAWLLVVVINVTGVTLLSEFNLIETSTAPLYWPALLVGGFLFGAGMVIAGGCASGTFYRAGRGMLGSWAALIGFAAGAAAQGGGALTPVQDILRRPRIEIAGAEPTLFSLVNARTALQRWIVVAVIVIPIILWLVRAPKERFVLGWGWRRTGIVVGGIALIAWVVSSATGRPFGISFTQPVVALTRWILTGDASGVSVATWIVVAVPAGAFGAAALRGEAVLSVPDAATLLRQGGGGIVMGLGASLAGGCNIGHGVTGIATLGIGSLVGVGSIMVGCWAMTAVVFRRSMGPRKRIALNEG